MVDDFKSHKGERFCGANIISTDKFIEISKKDSSIIAVNTCRFDYSRRYFENLCREQNIPSLNFEQAIRLFKLNDFIDYRQSDWGPVILENVEKFSLLAEKLSDQYSRDTLYSVLLFHITCDPEWYLNIAKPYSSLYFRSGLFSLSQNERLVDCGASIGESTSALIDATGGSFDHSWMIEPDKYNIATLENMIRKYKASQLDGKISLHPYAVGESKDTLEFNHIGWHGGSIAYDGKGNGKVQVDTIDSIINDRPTIIKMDIEGAELAALKGASESIKVHRPKLLVSAYHRSTDLLQIPELVQQYRDDYKIGLRHHTEDRWDTCLYFY